MALFTDEIANELTSRNGPVAFLVSVEVVVRPFGKSGEHKRVPAQQVGDVVVRRLITDTAGVMNEGN